MRMRKRFGKIMTNFTSKVGTFFVLVISYLTYALSFLVPRSEKICIFIGWHRNKERELFADNSKYLYLYVHENYCNSHTSVWIGKDRKLTRILTEKGYKAHYIWSFAGVYYSLRAGYTFIDGLMEGKNWQFSGRSKIIQLWHGKGLKKTGFDSDYSLKRYNKILFPYLFPDYYRVVASSKYTAKLMSSTFRINSEKILITGLPRNDVFYSKFSGSEIDTNEEMMKLVRLLSESGAKKILLYAPTFRTDGSNPLIKFDFGKLDSVLQKLNFHLVVSLHPKFAGKKIASKQYSNIHLVGAGLDNYPVLSKMDALITDYSSIYIDYLLLNKPIIFFSYDLNDYKRSMGLHDDYERLTPGLHPKNIDELCTAVQLIEADKERNQRESIRGELFSYLDGSSCSRILEGLGIRKS